MSTVAFDVAAARARFSALEHGLAFFDGPGGTQVPDEVIDAIAAYLRESNANVSGPYETSRRTERLVADARLAAGSLLGGSPDEVIFGANMTTLNFALSRTVAREWSEGDEVVVTRLDHDGNVSPWLELAHDLGLIVRFANIRDDTTLDLEDLGAQLTDRTRVVAFPWASNAVGTLVDVARVTELAHPAGPRRPDGQLPPLRRKRHGRTGFDLRVERRRPLAARRGSAAGRTRNCGLAGQLLRRRGHEAARPGRRRGSGRDRPLQHGRGSGSAARRAGALIGTGTWVPVPETVTTLALLGSRRRPSRPARGGAGAREAPGGLLIDRQHDRA